MRAQRRRPIIAPRDERAAEAGGSGDEGDFGRRRRGHGRRERRVVGRMNELRRQKGTLDAVARFGRLRAGGGRRSELRRPASGRRFFVRRLFVGGRMRGVGTARTRRFVSEPRVRIVMPVRRSATGVRLRCAGGRGFVVRPRSGERGRLVVLMMGATTDHDVPQHAESGHQAHRRSQHDDSVVFRTPHRSDLYRAAGDSTRSHARATCRTAILRRKGRERPITPRPTATAGVCGRPQRQPRQRLSPRGERPRRPESRRVKQGVPQPNTAAPRPDTRPQ